MKAKRAKQLITKPERRDVLIRRVDAELWRGARVAAMERGITMAAWLEDVIRREVPHVCK